MTAHSALVVEVVKAAELVVLADKCGDHYTCEMLVQDALWGDGTLILDKGKPLCPWIVRPGKCQPEVAMMILKHALLDLAVHEYDPTLCAAPTTEEENDE